MKGIKRILVVSISTAHCQKAVQYGIALAKQGGARLYVLHVFHDPFGLDAWSLPEASWKEVQEEYQNMQNKARAELDQIIEEEQGKGVPIEVLLENGDPADKILNFVKENKIDLLLMLAYEEDRLEHLLFGRSIDRIIRLEYLLFGRSIDRIIRKLPCSVLLVKQEPGRTK